jgi:trans-aconitate methyltransferase
MKKLWIKNPEKRKEYYKISGDREPSPLLLRALDDGNFSTALDLGAGAGVDAKEMSRRGISVTAVDINTEVKKFFKQNPEIKLVILPIQDFKFGKYDLIYTKSAIVFLPENEYHKLLEKVKKALNKGGMFAARLWGTNDSANRPERKGKITFTSKQELEKIFKDFEMLYLHEIEKDGKTALGQPKHWHLIDIIVKNQE